MHLDTNTRRTSKVLGGPDDCPDQAVSYLEPAQRTQFDKVTVDEVIQTS